MAHSPRPPRQPLPVQVPIGSVAAAAVDDDTVSRLEYRPIPQPLRAGKLPLIQVGTSTLAAAVPSARAAVPANKGVSEPVTRTTCPNAISARQRKMPRSTPTRPASHGPVGARTPYPTMGTATSAAATEPDSARSRRRSGRIGPTAATGGRIENTTRTRPAARWNGRRTAVHSLCRERCTPASSPLAVPWRIRSRSWADRRAICSTVETGSLSAMAKG